MPGMFKSWGHYFAAILLCVVILAFLWMLATLIVDHVMTPITRAVS